MFKENDTIVAKKDISPEILKDTIGVIHSVYEVGKFYLIEFIDNKGQTIGDGLELVSFDDIDFYKD